MLFSIFMYLVTSWILFCNIVLRSESRVEIQDPKCQRDPIDDVERSDKEKVAVHRKVSDTEVILLQRSNGLVVFAAFLFPHLFLSLNFVVSVLNL